MCMRANMCCIHVYVHVYILCIAFMCIYVAAKEAEVPDGAFRTLTPKHYTIEEVYKCIYMYMYI